MSATRNDQGRQTPLIVVDAAELREHLMRDAEGIHGALDAYHDNYTWNKTDISANPAGVVAASRQVLAGNVHSLGGWALLETTGAAGALIRLRDGQAAAGEVFVPIALAAGESTRDMFGKHGVRCLTGRVSIEIVSGSVSGVVYWR